MGSLILFECLEGNEGEEFEDKKSTKGEDMVSVLTSITSTIECSTCDY